MTPDPSNDPTIHTSQDTDAEVLEHPERIGPYKILQVIGEGGMGVVYHAEQTAPVQRRVALKMMKVGMDTREVVARFEAERQALAVMDHPNIAKVLDAGASETGRPYFVMEHVKGVPLTDYCDTNKLSTKSRLELFIPICQAVQHAHQKGVIHRDLKPSNVLVTVQQGTPTPKIIDFGIAKAIGQRLTEKTLVTAYGVAMGTPAYMSPEQAEMTGLDVDTRTDVYSLGVMLYELLVGRLPVDPDEIGLQGFMAQLVLREMETPTPSARLSGLGGAQKTVAYLRTTHPTTLRKELRGDLDWIVMKAMEKDRTRRYETANGLALDIRRHLRHEPVLARAPSAAYWIGKFARRHKAGVGFAATLLLLVVGVAVAMTLQAASIARERDRANLEAETAAQVSEFLVGLFEVSDPSQARGSTITAREILDEGAQKITEELADQPVIQARLMNSMGKVYRNLGLHEQAEQMLQQALTLRRDAYGEEHLEVAQSLHNLAVLYRARGRFAEAESLLVPALASKERSLGANHLDLAGTLTELAVIYRRQGRFDEAEPLFQRAVIIRERALGPDHPELARTLNSLANLYAVQGKFPEAEQLYRRALTIREAALGPDHPTVGSTLNNLAIVNAQQENHAEAVEFGERALAVREKVLGPDHPNLAQTIGNLAIFYEDVERYADAERLHKRGLAIYEKTLRPGHPRLATALGNLADLYVDQGKFSDAQPLIVQALAIGEKELGSQHPDLVSILHNMAMVHRHEDNYAEATALLERVLAIIENAHGSDHPDFPRRLESYAALFREMGRAAEADSMEARARALRGNQGK
jgi:non-specific serine/threonine protein kinase/serine/threonine-protein kinase